MRRQNEREDDIATRAVFARASSKTRLYCVTRIIGLNLARKRDGQP